MPCFISPPSLPPSLFLRFAICALAFHAVANLCAEDIADMLATVHLHCPDKSPQWMGKCLRELCEMVSDSMVAQVDVKLAEGWFLCWETMLALRGTGWKYSVVLLSELYLRISNNNTCSLCTPTFSLASTGRLYSHSSAYECKTLCFNMIIANILLKVQWNPPIYFGPQK